LKSQVKLDCVANWTTLLIEIKALPVPLTHKPVRLTFDMKHDDL